MTKVREVVAYKNHFEDFLKKQSKKVQDKIFKVIEAIETLERVPSNYLKLLLVRMDYMRQELNLVPTFGEYSVFSKGEGLLFYLMDLQKRHRKHQKAKLIKHLN